MSITVEIKIRRESGGEVEEHAKTVTIPAGDNPRFTAYELQQHAPKVLNQVIRKFGDPDDMPGTAP